MNFGGLVRFSLSDYPGHVSAVVFTQGCNLRCPFCHNGPLLPMTPEDGTAYPEEEILAYLESRKKRLDGVVVTGGEPTLQADLSRFLRTVKGMGLKTKLDTNGTRPEVLRTLFYHQLVDYVAMDVKAALDDAEAYDRLTGVRAPIDRIRESAALIVASGVPYELRTTVVEPLLSVADVARIELSLPKGATWRVQTFRPELALDPALRAEVVVNAAARS